MSPWYTPSAPMLDIMGHMSAAKLRKYSHIRVKARRNATDSVEVRHPLNAACKIPYKKTSRVALQRP